MFALMILLAPLFAQAADAYVNGRWYDGSGFVDGTVYVIDGRLSRNKPARLENTYDLDGQYVIPPFAEAHNHDLTSDLEPRERIDEYLRDGVFYAKMQSAFSKRFDELQRHFNRPDSIDVAFAFAPITGPGGHPVRIRELFFERGYYDEFFATKAEMAGIGYTEVRDEEDLLKKFPRLLDQNPDFIKVMLSYAEE